VTFTDQEIREGIARLGKQPDAKFLRKRLLSILMSLPPADAGHGALAEQNGRRTLASDLLNALEFTTDGRTDDDAELARRSTAPSGIASARSRSRVPAVSPDDAADGPVRGLSA
jgi:hypothetical protein